MLAAAEQNAADGTHVIVVAAVGDGDVLLARHQPVGRIEVDPACLRRPNRNPRVGSVRAGKPRLPGRRARQDIAADIARRQPQRAQAGSVNSIRPTG